MKRTILVALIVAMIVTPCLAQEVEPEGIFSLHGTKWNSLAAIVILPFPWLFSPYFSGYTGLGFYDKEVYPSLSYDFVWSFYVDMIVASVFVYHKAVPRGSSEQIGFGFMQPIGIGMMIEYDHHYRSLDMLTTWLLIKTNDNWTPPGVE